MILTLEIIGPQAHKLARAGRKVFNGCGGTIGRLPDNDWVLPDPYISGRHASIRYRDGQYFIEDTSTNGVFINSPQQRLSRSMPQQLHHGDLIYIDAYCIEVSLRADKRVQPRAQTPESLRGGAASRVSPRVIAPLAVGRDEHTANLPVDAAGDVVQGIWGERSFAGLDVDQHGPQDPVEGAHDAPWWRTAEDVRDEPASRRAVRDDHAPAARPGAAPDADSDLAALLQAAGIEGLQPSREVAETLGAVLRITMSGVMEVLRSRERMKDQLRMRGTIFQAADNNPLKFSANADDAFHNLLVKHNPAYLSPVDAFEEALRDVRDHQTAVQEALRLAFEAMLAQFDPERLQQGFDRQMKGAILGVPVKLRYWDLFRDRYAAMNEDAEASFRTLFGDAFAQAYEEHVERHQGRGRKRND